MFGEGISILELTKLFTAVREKDLVLQVKITDGPWKNLSGPVVTEMVQKITTGAITQSADIRMRLFAKGG
jgi:hypothetical protein